MISINGIKIEPTIFPDKTSQVWKLPTEIFRRHVIVRWDFENEAEIFHICQLKRLLDASGSDSSLEMSYLPYARQDKTVDNDHAFALRAFAEILNMLGFAMISCVDAHSMQAENLIDRLRVSYPVGQVRAAAKDYDLICFPDEGAAKKYSKIYPHTSIKAHKIRDQQSGKIISMELEDAPLESYRALIVDDICDGGATFLELARLLYESGATDVGLFVSHGIFSRGLEPLRKAGINRIFTKEGEK